MTADATREGAARVRWALAVALLASAGCSIFEKPTEGETFNGGTDGTDDEDIIVDETDADTDADADADADADVDTGADGGGDGEDTAVDSGEPEPTVDCTAGAYPASPGVDECVADTISCGEELLATNDGGSALMNDDDYLAWYCAPFPAGSYDGPERTYALRVPAGLRATITLDGPCDELDLFALRWEFWESDGDCPETGNPVWECEADDSRAGGDVLVVADSTRDTNYLVIVDSPNGSATNFGLRVDCE